LNEKYAVAYLTAIKEVFDNLGVEFWLHGGTCLGAIRDGKIIEWDHDIDLGICSDDEKKLFSALHELKRRKFEFVLLYPVFPNCGLVQLWLFPDTQIDIVLWQVKADKFVHSIRLYKKSHMPHSVRFSLAIATHYLYCDLALSVTDKKLKPIAGIVENFLPQLPLKLKMLLLKILRGENLLTENWLFFEPKRYLEKLDTTEFYGVKFHIPHDVEDFLKYHYGENWKTPSKKWDFIKDDGAKGIKGTID